MKINTKLDKGNWVEWEDGVEFLLRPYPLSQMSVDEDAVSLGSKMFKYCIINWKGLVSEDTNKPIQCNEKMKQYFYDHFPNMSEFVAVEVTAMMGAEKDNTKNL